MLSKALDHAQPGYRQPLLSQRKPSAVLQITQTDNKYLFIVFPTNQPAMLRPLNMRAVYAIPDRTAYIVTLAQEHTSAIAAERCHVSQPNAERWGVQEARDELGVMIFEAQQDACQVTPIGERIVGPGARRPRRIDDHSLNWPASRQEPCFVRAAQGRRYLHIGPYRFRTLSATVCTTWPLGNAAVYRRKLHPCTARTSLRNGEPGTAIITRWLSTRPTC